MIPTHPNCMFCDKPECVCPDTRRPIMTMSAHGRKLLMDAEGFRTHVYRDVAGYPTIGVGHLLTQSETMSGKITIGDKTVRWGDGLTVQQVKDLLAQDLKQFESAVNLFVEVDLKPWQFDALVSFAFNVGITAFRHSTLLKLLNQGQYEQVPAQLRRWNKAGGMKRKGLVKRREHEVEIWTGKGYEVSLSC